ncbi:MAG: PilZ domain-containing protein [Acidobacteriota bacterium]
MQVNKQESTRSLNQVLPERRRAQRFRVRWDVTVRGVDGKGRIFDEVGYLQNLSSTGALMILPRCPAPDARLSVRVTIPFKKRSCIGYSARVARVEETGPRRAVALVFDNQRPSFADS